MDPPAAVRRDGRARCGRPGASGCLGLLAGTAGLLREASRAVVPLACAGCGAWDVVLCEECRACLVPQRLDGDASALRDPLPVWGLGPYQTRLRRVVLAWKTGGRRDVERHLHGPLGAAAHGLLVAAAVGVAGAADGSGTGLATGLATGPANGPATGLATGPANGPATRPMVGPRAHRDDGDDALWVVPAPSGPGRALRGRPPVYRLAAPVAAEVARGGRDAAVVLALGVPPLRLRGQRGAGSRMRRQHAAVHARVPLTGRDVLLVDDVLTTGATLQACCDAVHRAGGRVHGAVVLAAARAPGRHSAGARAGPLSLPTRVD